MALEVRLVRCARRQFAGAGAAEGLRHALHGDARYASGVAPTLDTPRHAPRGSGQPLPPVAFLA